MTARVLAERRLALVAETQHRLLAQLFPRHVLQGITRLQLAATAAAVSIPASPAAAAEAAPPPPRRSATGTGAVAAVDYAPLATWHGEVTLLCADVVGFTPMCSAVHPTAVMAMLNDLFSRFDALLDVHGVSKVRCSLWIPVEYNKQLMINESAVSCTACPRWVFSTHSGGGVWLLCNKACHATLCCVHLPPAQGPTPRMHVLWLRRKTEGAGAFVGRDYVAMCAFNLCTTLRLKQAPVSAVLYYVCTAVSRRFQSWDARTAPQVETIGDCYIVAGGLMGCGPEQQQQQKQQRVRGGDAAEASPAAEAGASGGTPGSSTTRPHRGAHTAEIGLADVAGAGGNSTTAHSKGRRGSQSYRDPLHAHKVFAFAQVSPLHPGQVGEVRAAHGLWCVLNHIGTIPMRLQPTRRKGAPT